MVHPVPLGFNGTVPRLVMYLPPALNVNEKLMFVSVRGFGAVVRFTVKTVPG